MRNNKAILDEAARSVRRTFVGSVAGSVVMLGVVGAAGAYGMPEKLTAQAFNAAMAKFNIKFAPLPEHTAQPVEQMTKLAANTKLHTPSPVSDAMLQDSVVVTVPQAAPVVAPPVRVAAAAPVAEAAPTPAPSVTVVEKTPVVEARPSNPFRAADPEPTPAPLPVPTVTASLAPVALPIPAVEPPPSYLSGSMVFEAPKMDDIQTLTEMPRTEPLIIEQPQTTPAAETPQPAKVEPSAQPPKPAEKPMMALLPPEQTNVAAEPNPADFPKSVMILLPQPKPPLSPAQRLSLQGKDYDKAEKCLAQAVYFEARNEPARGQQAVAQVVLNRVFSPYYPKDVCSVVYQNAHRHLSCQFTFACDGKPEAVNERSAWQRASRIATQTLNAKVWLPEVNKATHYHAAYVRPNWIRDMNVMVRYGLHTFYRPRNWGDGSNEAHWGTAANSVKPAAATAAKPLTPAQKRFAYRKT